MLKVIAIAILVCTSPICTSGFARNEKDRIYTEWNACVESLKAEGDFESGKWRQLYNSLRADPPGLVRSLDREQLLKDLIRLHKERTGYLESMLKLERGH